MRILITILAIFVFESAPLMAQEALNPPRGLGYVFFGPATNQMGLTAGFGGEGYVSKNFAIGLEAGTTGFTTISRGNPNWIGLGSANFSYHFSPKQYKGKVAPFITGGYTNFFGQDTDTPGGNTTNGLNVGGGVDLFASKRLGVRFDARYYAHGGRILWPSFPSGTDFNFTAIRIGLTFR
jgi:hypothetical protein